MNDDPTKPTLNSRGAYDSADLARYFREAKSMGDAEIARHLGVEVHRIIFMRQRMKHPDCRVGSGHADGAGLVPQSPQAGKAVSFGGEARQLIL